MAIFPNHPVIITWHDNNLKTSEAVGSVIDETKKTITIASSKYNDGVINIPKSAIGFYRVTSYYISDDGSVQKDNTT